MLGLISTALAEIHRISDGGRLSTSELNCILSYVASSRSWFLTWCVCFF